MPQPAQHKAPHSSRDGAKFPHEREPNPALKERNRRTSGSELVKAAWRAAGRRVPYAFRAGWAELRALSGIPRGSTARSYRPSPYAVFLDPFGADYDGSRVPCPRHYQTFPTHRRTRCPRPVPSRPDTIDSGKDGTGTKDPMIHYKRGIFLRSHCLKSP